jgi:hypothetical protein
MQGVTKLLSLFAHESNLVAYLKELFPGQIHTNSKTILNIQSPITGSSLEVDVWVNDLDLGFEFQVLPAIKNNN